MGLFAKMLMVWNAILPFLTAQNAAAVQNAFDQVMDDYRTGQYDKAIDDLAKSLKSILPKESHQTVDDASGN